MKIRFIIFAALLCSFTQIAGQAPAKFNYQAVARNTAGNLIINQNISVRVSILTGSVSGTSEYQETHSVTTDGFGVFNILVGGGTVVSGTFAGITWGSASKFLKIEADVTGGTTYQAIATTQILSAPYALYANESGTKTFNDSEFSIIYAGGIADNPATAPNAVLGGMGAGSIDNGTHDYKVTFVTSAGETGAGPASASVSVTSNAADGKILVSGIPVSAKTNVTSRNLYRRFNGTGDYKMVTSIANNTTTTYIDNISNSSLGKVLPTSNGTTNNVMFDASLLTSNHTLSIPDKSGSIVIDKNESIPIEIKSNRSLMIQGESVIQNLINGPLTIGAYSGQFYDAYVDPDGRNNSLVQSPNTLIFDYSGISQKKIGAFLTANLSGGDAVNDPYGFNGTSNAFDGDLTTSASKGGYDNIVLSLGKTFTARSNLVVRIKASTVFNANGANERSASVGFETFNGSTWDYAGTLATKTAKSPSSADFDGVILIPTAVQGIRIVFSGGSIYSGGGGVLYELDYGYSTTPSILEHMIPSGTFNLGLSKVFMTVLKSNWEDGCDIEYKLINSTEDSGWLKHNTPSTFLPFTKEPTKLMIKLIPKSINPSAGFPSIYGFYLTEF
jgi:hypothetical protein